MLLTRMKQTFAIGVGITVIIVAIVVYAYNDNVWPQIGGETHRGKTISLHASNVHGGQIWVKWSLFSDQRGRVAGNRNERGDWEPVPFARIYQLSPGETMRFNLTAGVNWSGERDHVSCEVMVDGEMAARDSYIKVEASHIPDVICHGTVVSTA